MKTAGGWRLPEADRYFGPMLDKDMRGFQIDHLETALKYVKQRRYAVDGGAHIGTWSARLAKDFEDVLAFEPALDTYRCLVKNVTRSPHVVPLRGALGASNMWAAIKDDPTRPGNTGARFIGPGNDFRVFRLDDFRIDDLDFLKLDLEGYEYFALCGAVHTVGRCKPVVLIEDKDFGGRYPVERGAAGRLLESWGAKLAARVKNDCIYLFPEG